MNLEKAKSGSLIKELQELEKYREELIKELDKRYEQETPVVKKYIKKVKGGKHE